MDEIEKNNGEIIIYQTEDGRTQLEVRLENVIYQRQNYDGIGAASYFEYLEILE